MFLSETKLEGVNKVTITKKFENSSIWKFFYQFIEIW